VGGVGGAVEDQGAHPVQEPLQVSRAQFRAVAVAEVVDLILAERLANRVHILCRRGSSDTGQKGLAHSIQALLYQ
jgi:hypothetical protein